LLFQAGFFLFRGILGNMSNKKQKWQKEKINDLNNLGWKSTFSSSGAKVTFTHP